MKLQTREYQVPSVRNLRRLLKDDKRVVAVGPTGSGKTLLATLLIDAERLCTVIHYPGTQKPTCLELHS